MWMQVEQDGNLAGLSSLSHELYSLKILLHQNIWGFSKIDHSGIDARIVLEQNKIQQKSYL